MTRLPPWTQYECPGCGYRVGESERRQAPYDYYCPECGEHRMAEFERVKDRTARAARDGPDVGGP